ncbi:hypothetical protein ASG31_14695 [Chryseobacterium sp. Leaf404]|uniref:glycosyltransferase family A protein n=1 Tax=unclassified Chryseobacterium TaxID=2593645 RepID=UPI0006F74873|nr:MULTISPECIES: glycosyltransferase family A protein [unclassified Chryseobacterium]KQT15507.1 hypothetical protein ASG31_14695 [Chryseobacterium sp. Leaf404]
MSKLAIVIPYYKIDFFEETLKSVAAQSNRDFVLYIGNDASANNPLPLIQKHLTDISYFYFDYTDNLGAENLALQWERILENVEEEWFQILGDDDIISENFVEEFYYNIKNAEEQSISVIRVSQALIDENGIQTTEFTVHPTILPAIEAWKSKIIDHQRSSLSEHIFNLHQFRKIKFRKFPLAWYSDDIAVYEISDFENIYFIDSAKVLVRFSEKSISGKSDNETEKSLATFQFLNLLIEKFHHRLPKEFVLNTIDKLNRTAHENHSTKNSKFSRVYMNYGMKAMALEQFMTSVPVLRPMYQTLRKAVDKIKDLKKSRILSYQKKRPFQIPIIIINFNQLYFLRTQVEFYIKRGFSNIVIVDNHSTYPPLLEYYRSIEHQVKIEYMSQNYGHLVFFKREELYRKYGKGYYVITDADILPNEKLPENFMFNLITFLHKYQKKVLKVGFALRLDDIPETNNTKQKIINWEQKFWIDECEPDIFYADIDTTFALYSTAPTEIKLKSAWFFRGLRFAGDYAARHGGWYIDNNNLTDEQNFYAENANSSSSWLANKEGEILGDYKKLYK